MSFKDKVVLVTGASSGIGAAVAIEFSSEGAKVVMVGRNEAKLSAVAAQCVKPLVIIADVSKDEDVRRIMEQTIKKFGQLDVLVNNAGFASTGDILAGNMMKAYDEVMNTNVRGLIYMTTVAAPHLAKTKGNVINISSVAALITPIRLGMTNYHVSKAAVTHFGACAAAELGPHGIRVNTISPGPVKTDFVSNIKTSANVTDTLDYDTVKTLTCLNRYSESKEIADLVLFVASDKAKGITGSDFLTDNGMLVKRR